jgi:hypothetical protein
LHLEFHHFDAPRLNVGFFPKIRVFIADFGWFWSSELVDETGGATKQETLVIWIPFKVSDTGIIW